jgi:uncharacterized membrane protein
VLAKATVSYRRSGRRAFAMHLTHAGERVIGVGRQLWVNVLESFRARHRERSRTFRGRLRVR